ncbi:MAG: hypothetical protein ISS53_03420 [Dehalococcoidia bacterium]|nr:hypothetical protein [Dehalococcoidia bacterium]
MYLIVATVQDDPAMDVSIKRAAERLVHSGKAVTEGLLNVVEMAFRVYYGCMACVTHTLPGHMPLEVVLSTTARKRW